MTARAPLLAILLCALGACERGAAHDVAYYAAHPDERSARIAACGDRPGREDSADCAAALSADARAVSQRSARYVRPVSRLNRAGAL